jgi:hypothetical protein
MDVVIAIIDMVPFDINAWIETNISKSEFYIVSIDSIRTNDAVNMIIL